MEMTGSRRARGSAQGNGRSTGGTRAGPAAKGSGLTSACGAGVTGGTFGTSHSQPEHGHPGSASVAGSSEATESASTQQQCDLTVSGGQQRPHFVRGSAGTGSDVLTTAGDVSAGGTEDRHGQARTGGTTATIVVPTASTRATSRLYKAVPCMASCYTANGPRVNSVRFGNAENLTLLQGRLGIEQPAPFHERVQFGAQHLTP